jgi:uncharacterized protein (DUF58 family)
MMAACLAYLVLMQRDAVSLTIFDSELRHFVPRSDNRSTLLNIMDKLAGFEPQQATNISGVLHDTALKVRRRGIVILISDLFDDESKVMEGIQHLRFGGHEVIVFHVMDPYELDFPFRGLVEFVGLEKFPAILTRPNEIRKTYLGEVQAFCQRMREGCERNKCHYVPVNTGRELHEVLSGYLAFRTRTTVK